MKRFFLAALALSALVVPAGADNEPARITGQYLEARTCDVYTGPCFANADFNLGGKNGMMAWRIDQGSFEGVKLDGLGVVAVVTAANTIGLEQNAPAQAILIVDSKASSQQKEALVRMAQRQAGQLLENIVAVRDGKIQLTICDCNGGTCAEMDAGVAKIKTRCLTKHDKACGNESAYYPPMTRGVTVLPGVAVDHIYRGQSLGTWSDHDRRSAFVGTFEVK